MKAMNLDSTNLHELNKIVKSNLINTKFRSLGEYKYLLEQKKESAFDNKFVASMAIRIEQHLLGKHYDLVLEAVLSEKAMQRLMNYAIEYVEFHDFEEKRFEGYSPYDYAKKAIDNLLNFGTFGTYLEQFKSGTNVLKVVLSNSSLFLYSMQQPVQKSNLILDESEVQFLYDKVLNLAKKGQHYENDSNLTLETNDYSLHITKTGEDMHVVFNLIQKQVTLCDDHFYEVHSGTQSMLSLLKTALRVNLNVAIVGSNESITTDAMNYLAKYIHDYRTISVIEKFKKTRVSDIYSKKSVTYWSLKERDVESIIQSPSFETDWLFINEPSMDYRKDIASYAASHNVVATFKNTEVTGFPLIVQFEQGLDHKMYRITKLLEYVEATGEYRLLFEYVPFDDSFNQVNQLSVELSEYLRKSIKIPSTLKPLIQEKSIEREPIIAKDEAQPIHHTSTTRNDDFFSFGQWALTADIEKKSTQSTDARETKQKIVDDSFFSELVGGK